MTLKLEKTRPEFQRDGSFIDEALETPFQAHIWKRDCDRISTVTIPVALAVLITIPVDGSILGWTNPVFLTVTTLHLIAALFCIATRYVFSRPSPDRQALALPFAATLSVNALILYAVASGTNGTDIATPTAITATLVYWAFIPLSVRQLVIAGATLCFGYLAILLLWFSDDLQTIVLTPVLLMMINAIGFFHVRNRKMAERKEYLANQQLRRTTKTLQTEMESRIAAEQHAGAREKMFQGVFISSPVPLCMIDAETEKLIRANNSMISLLGYSRKEWPDHPIGDFVVDIATFERLIQRVQTEKSIMREEILIKTATGNPIWVILSAQKFSMPGRDTLLASFVDITDQKQKENDLALVTEDARKSNFAKSQFLANMSHELRTPLNAIIGFSDIIESEVFGKVNNARYLDYVSDIKASGIHLLSIINEILDLSKIESGKKELCIELVDLNQVVSAAARLVRPHTQDKSIDLEVGCSSAELILYADERATKQIILNLLSNAVKFTSNDGSVSIRTFEKDGHAIVEVRDTGIGIPLEQLETITEPFVQLQSILTNTVPGTGLGLPIAKRLAELHNGRIEFESQEGEGTTVRLVLPLIDDERLVL